MCHALATREEARAGGVSELVDRLFDGSTELLFATLLNWKPLDGGQRQHPHRALNGKEKTDETHDNTAAYIDAASYPYRLRWGRGRAKRRFRPEFCPGIRVLRDGGRGYFSQWTGDDAILYGDKSSGTGGILCGKPECEHSDDTCNAYYPGALYKICSYDGRLYIIRSGVKVYSCNYDGTDRREMMALSRDLIPNSGLYCHFQIHRCYLYYSDVNETVENGEAKYIYKICAFPLDPDGEGF